MASPEWVAWAERHARVFGMTADADAAMLSEWCDLFSREGFSPAELNSATDRMTTTPPRFRSDHLIGLRREIAEDRRRKLERQPDDRGTCEACSGSGTVEVPLEGRSTPGGNVHQPGTLGVALCKCAIGRWKAQAGSPVRTLEEYERSNPYWKDKLASIKALWRARHKAIGRASELDKALGEILRRAQAKTKPAPSPPPVVAVRSTEIDDLEP